MLLWKKKKKEEKDFYTAAAYGISWILGSFHRTQVKNRFLSFFKSTQNVFMLSTYSSQKPIAPRQSLTTWNMLACDYSYSSTHMHTPTYRKEAELWRTQEPKCWFPVLGWHHWCTIHYWKPPCLEAFPRLLASLLCKIWEDKLFSGDPQNKTFHNWLC